MVRLAVVGCAHGELDAIYQCLEEMKQASGVEVDAVLCCGDFQAVRDQTDLGTMACPVKYRQMHDFWKYYTGEKKAPVLTMFVGGNHEASNLLQDLPLGGFVAPNVFYMGYASAVRWNGLVILGLSGIYKSHDYNALHWETAPYTSPPNSMRSVYHIRRQDVDRVLQWAREPGAPRVDIALSHDWPRGIECFGNTKQLLRNKPHFRADVQNNQLGSPPLWEILAAARPSHWFSAHLHTKFTAQVPPGPGESSDHIVRFLALDKVLPGRPFLQYVNVSKEGRPGDPDIHLDQGWISTLRKAAGLPDSPETPTLATQYKNPSSHEDVEPPCTQTARILAAISPAASIEALFPKRHVPRPMPPANPSTNTDEIKLDL